MSRRDQSANSTSANRVVLAKRPVTQLVYEANFFYAAKFQSNMWTEYPRSEHQTLLLGLYMSPAFSSCGPFSRTVKDNDNGNSNNGMIL